MFPYSTWISCGALKCVLIENLRYSKANGLGNDCL